MAKIELIVLGNPKAQARHRTYTKGRGGKPLPFPIQVDPSVKDKSNLRAVVQNQAPEKLLDGPLRVDCSWYFPRPKSHYRTGKYANQLKPDAPKWYIPKRKNDRDNLDKLVLDALSGIFYIDDGQVCFGVLSKQYSEKPRTEILIETI